MNSKFSAYILSNGCRDFYPDNTLSKFAVKFPFSLDLSINGNEKWAISLNSIGLSSKFESKYLRYNSDPLMIQITNFLEKEHCYHLEVQRKNCEEMLFEYNNDIIKLYNKCYFGSEIFSNCNVVEIRDFFRHWGLSNLNFGSNYESNNPKEPFGGIHQFSYFYNSLENNEDLNILIENLKDGDLIVTKKSNSKYEITPNRAIEKIIFIRTDLADRLTITQNFKPVDQNFRERPKRLFNSVISARNLNNNIVNTGSHNYKLFVFNIEYKSLTLEFKKFMNGYLAIPNLIKIKCQNIRSQVFNNTYSQDIELVKPEFNEKGEHYFHEFETPLFIPLLNTNLNSLKFQLTDEYDEQLSLSTGLPTILSATFMKMPSDYKCFNIRLTPTTDSVENNSSKFKTVLPNTFTFNEKWSVGLKDITFPNQFKNLPSDDNDIVIIKLTNELKVIQNERHKIPIPNIKANLQEFLNYLNLKMTAVNAFTFELDSNTNTVSIKSKTNANISISKNLAQFLGFLPLIVDSDLAMNYWKYTIKANEVKKADLPVNLVLFRPAFLMVYLDFIELTLISGVYTNIVKIVPVKMINNDDVECQTLEFKTIEFRKLGKMVVSEINTEIRDPSGKLVQFNNDKLGLHLFFTNSQLS